MTGRAADPDHLTVRLEPYDEWNREIVVSAQSVGFAGSTRAYISMEAIERFARSLAEYPLSQSVVLETGFLESPRSDRLDPELLWIEARQTSTLGQVALRVRLAIVDWSTGRPVPNHEVRLELPVTYQGLRQFSDDLWRLLTGEVSEVRIEGEILA